MHSNKLRIKKMIIIFKSRFKRNPPQTKKKKKKSAQFFWKMCCDSELQSQNPNMGYFPY